MLSTNATIEACLRWAQRELQGSAADAPLLSAQVLLAHLLNCSRLHLLVNKDQVVPSAVQQEFKALIARRAQCEPVAYLLGRKEFYGREFIVNSSVLIPRPETELIIDSLLALLPRDTEFRFVDVCSGSGVLGITLAKEFNLSRGVLIDIEGSTLEIARQNAILHKVEQRLLFVRGDLLDCIQDETCFCIVANPPYISQKELAGLDVGVRRYEPELALLGKGENGLGHVYKLLSDIPYKLSPQGVALVEVGSAQYPYVRAYLEKECSLPVSWALKKDYAGHYRLVYVNKK